MKPRMTKVQREAVEAMLKGMASQAPLTPDRVVAAAEPDDSPLHAWFEWDDTVAGAAYRRIQARDLITSVEVVHIIEEREVEVPYFVRDPAQDHDKQGYITLDRLRQDPAQARQHLQAELKAVLAILRRADSYAQILNLTGLLEGVRTSVRRLSARIEGKPLQ